MKIPIKTIQYNVALSILTNDFIRWLLLKIFGNEQYKQCCKKFGVKVDE